MFGGIYRILLVEHQAFVQSGPKVDKKENLRETNPAERGPKHIDFTGGHDGTVARPRFLLRS